MLRDVAFGGALNGLIVLIGSLLGAWIRDRFFFGADWFPLEPYVSIEWIVGMGLFMFMAALVWRYLSFSTRARRGPSKGRVRVRIRVPARSRGCSGARARSVLTESLATSSPRRRGSSVIGPCGRKMDPRLRGDDSP